MLRDHLTTFDDGYSDDFSLRGPLSKTLSLSGSGRRRTKNLSIPIPAAARSFSLEMPLLVFWPPPPVAPGRFLRAAAFSFCGVIICYEGIKN